MQTIILLACACLLLVALIGLWGRKVKAARTRNVITLDVECDAEGAREAIRQLTADYERLNSQMERAGRNILELKVRRTSEPAPRGGNVNPRPTYARPPAPPAPPPPPASKKKRPSRRS